MLDRLFSPFERILVDEVVAQGARNILDIGCGAGAASLAIAEQLKDGGACTGVDISQALVDVACRRAAAAKTNARFLCADAQRYNFAPNQYDAIVSRFGVMFFDDPVSAFANMRSAARLGAMLSCIVWRGASDNPFMATQHHAIADVLGSQAHPDPHAPGQFAFADDERVRDILAEAGWGAIEIQPITVPCELPTGELPVYARRMGGIEAILPDLDEVQSLRLQVALDAGFARFVDDGVVRFDAACWMVHARK